MHKLSPKEIDLLQRIEGKPELRPLFFRKVKGLKWFDALYEKNFFDPSSNPEPKPAKEEGYVNIPFWEVVDYLVKTSDELLHDKNEVYARKFLEILVDVTNYAKNSEFSNYRTWWQFSEILQKIPTKVVTLESLDVVDYWLSDNYDRNLVAQEIGCKWLPKLLSEDNEHSAQLAFKLLEFIYAVNFVDRKRGGRGEREALLRFDAHHAEKITEKISTLVGEKFGQKAILIFDAKLKSILSDQESDSWSYAWQPAIEDHSQNNLRDDAENTLIKAYRDSLSGYSKKHPNEAHDYVEDMLGGNYQTIHRLAIHAINTNFHTFSNLVDMLIDGKYLSNNYQHEIWHLLNKRYQQFTKSQQKKLLSLISSITREDEDEELREGRIAYDKIIWLSAIRTFGGEEEELYKKNVALAKTEPDHPDFSSYMTSGWNGSESPIPIEKLESYSVGELVKELEEYRDSGGYRYSGIEGLSRTFKQLVKNNPLKFYDQLNKFSGLDVAYIYEIIEAYRDLWGEKLKLPWDDVWPFLLEFCSKVVGQDRFWREGNSTQRQSFVANRYWVVSGMGRLIEAGTKVDDHAFSERYLKDAEKLLKFLLSKELGEEYKIDSDAVSISINSPRGHCLEALINMALRSCRIADMKNNKNHSDVWAHFQVYFDAELLRADMDKPEYEFATLVTNYLPNFLYMSKDWVLSNLSRIFNQDNYQKWLCAMQGFSYVGTVYQEIYQYLKDNDDLVKTLDDKNIKDRVEDKVVQIIIVAYLNDYESFSCENSLISTVVSRNDHEEINHLIWFIWSLRKKGDDNLKSKVFELWPRILENINFSTDQGRKTASQLCHWSIFVDQVDDEIRELLLTVAPYADEQHNAYHLLEAIAEISNTQSFEAYTIWMKLLEKSCPDYPEEAIRKVLSNLIDEGPEGLRKAKDAVSRYLERGNDRPASWLKDIRTKESV